MTVWFGVRVRCDSCGRDFDLDPTLVHPQASDARRAAAAEGWTQGKGRANRKLDACPACSIEEDPRD